MPVDSRSRMVSFRLTDHEFERCRDLCFRNGMRSVSEMARVAINLLIEQPSRASDGAIESRIAELEARLHILALQMKKLSQNAEEPDPAPAVEVAPLP